MVNIVRYRTFPENLFEQYNYNLYKKIFVICPAYYEMQNANFITFIANENEVPIAALIARVRGDSKIAAHFFKSLWVESGIIFLKNEIQNKDRIRNELIREVANYSIQL